MKKQIQCRDYALSLDRPLVQGILNVTPDSFHDGGKYMDIEKALAQAHKLVSQGANIIDIGGESTRPGAKPVSESEELRRIMPVVKRLVKEVNVPISIDTYKARVARECLDTGVHMVNDVTGLSNPEMAKVISEYDVPAFIMHMPGTPQTMRQHARYTNVALEVKKFLQERANFALESGIEQIIIDPGFGFGKTPRHNYELLRDLPVLREIKHPILIGTSKKSFGSVKNSLEILVIGMLHGANILRVHNAELAAKAIERYDEIKSQ